MSWETTAWARKLRGLGTTGKVVLLLMADHVNDHDEHVCWPSLPRLAADAELSRSTVWRTIERLEQLGVIERLGTREPGSSMRYRLCLEVTTPCQVDTTPSRQLTPGTPCQVDTTPVASGDTTPSRQVTPESPRISSESQRAHTTFAEALAAARGDRQ